MKCALLFIIFCGLAPLAANSLPSEQRKNNKLVQAVLEPIRVALQKSSAVFYSSEDRKSFIFGTVISKDGLILTKASELEEVKEYTVRVDEENFREVEIMATDEVWDLALVKVEASDLTPVTWASSSDLEHATWVVSNGATTRKYRRPRIGMISANKREIVGGHPAVLGVGLKAEEGGVKVTMVTEKSGAEVAGVEKDDLITAIDDTEVTKVEELQSLLKRYEVGDSPVLKIIRDKESLEFTVELLARHKLYGGKQNRNDAMSGEFSPRRTGFPMVLQHEITLSRRSVGGPLLNFKGECVGMNIAMANRVENYAIPVENLLEEILKLQELAAK